MKKAIRGISLLSLIWSAYMLIFYLFLLVLDLFEIPFFQNLGNIALCFFDFMVIPALYFGILAVPFLLLLLVIFTICLRVKDKNQKIFKQRYFLFTIVFCIAVLGVLYADIWTFELLS